MKSLWPKEIGEIIPNAPYTIMHDQGDFLYEKTNGVLSGHVIGENSASDNHCLSVFKIYLPYSKCFIELFRIRRLKDKSYPVDFRCDLTGEMSDISSIIANADEFCSTIRKTLAHDNVLETVRLAEKIEVIARRCHIDDCITDVWIKPRD